MNEFYKIFKQQFTDLTEDQLVHLSVDDINFSMMQEFVDEFLRLDRTLKIIILFRSLMQFNTSTHKQLLYSHEYE